MNRLIQFKQRPDIPVWGAYEGLGPKDNLAKYQPDYYLTRCWMGVVPPKEGSPGYTAVVGEMYEPDLQQRHRRVRILDEAVALDPADFSARECKRFNIPPDNKIRPTKRRLAQAIVALKDIYPVDYVFVPPGNKASRDGQQLAVPFTEFVRRIDGLTNYDPGLGTYYFREWFPFFKNTTKVAVVREVEHEDAEYNVALLDSLWESGMGQVANHCKIFAEDREADEYTRRCVGMILAQLEVEDITFQVRRWEFSDGYATPVDDPQAEAEAEEARKRYQDIWNTWAENAQ